MNEMEGRLTKQKPLKFGFITILALLASTSTARASAIPLVDIANDPTYSWTWAEDLTLGYSFSVASSTTFNALGVFNVISASPATSHTNTAALNASHQVGVWNSSGTLIATATVDPTDPTTTSQNTYGQWVYQTIAPITLT